MVKQSGIYEFSYPRIGGYDPFDETTDIQLQTMTKDLQARLGNDYKIFTERMSWLSATDPAHLPFPRGVYNPPPQTYCPIPSLPTPPSLSQVTYCAGDWYNCDPERYNVDGPVERLLKKDIDRLVIVDTVTTGVRFYKTFDQLTEVQKVVKQYNDDYDKDVTVEWVNDPTDLLVETYPTEPDGWTPSLGPPLADPVVSLEGRPNPFIDDPGLAALYVEGIAKRLRHDIPYSKQVSFVGDKMDMPARDRAGTRNRGNFHDCRGSSSPRGHSFCFAQPHSSDIAVRQ